MATQPNPPPTDEGHCRVTKMSGVIGNPCPVCTDLVYRVWGSSVQLKWGFSVDRHVTTRYICPKRDSQNEQGAYKHVYSSTVLYFLSMFAIHMVEQ